MVSIISGDTVFTLANVITTPSLLKSQTFWIKLNKKPTEPAEIELFLLLSSELFSRSQGISTALSGHV